MPIEKKASKTPPWKKPNPKKKPSMTMTEAQKDAARARAKAAGRPYPNLVDNMAITRTAKKKTAAKKTSRST